MPVHLSADNTFHLQMDNIQHRGNTSLLVNNPLVRLGANAKACELHFRSVVPEIRATTFGVLSELVSDQGVGNFGTWWNPNAD
jgi:hypothetical protein